MEEGRDSDAKADRTGHLQRAIPHRTSPSPRASALERKAGCPAHRRNRPFGRGVRSVPAGKSSPTTRSRFPRWEPSRRPADPWWCSPATGRARIHDALKRRCLYLWVDYPSFEKEVRESSRPRLPGVSDRLAEQISRFMDPGEASGFSTSAPAWPNPSIGRRRSSRCTGNELDADAVRETIGCILKYQDDIKRVESDGLDSMVATAQLAPDA